jgi:hypothetical protein
LAKEALGNAVQASTNSGKMSGLSILVDFEAEISPLFLISA